MLISAPLQIFRLEIAAAIQTLGEISPEQVRIDLAERHYAAHFSSSIAIAIAPKLRLAPLEIATQIAEFCQANSPFRNWQMQAVGKGWLNITLSESFILESLDQLLIWQPDRLIKQDNFWWRDAIVKANAKIEHNYAYARCCALMRLATRENLDLSTLPNIQKLLFPPDYVDLAELELCLEILAIADFVLTKAPRSQQELRKKLSLKFLQFYDLCPIFGVDRAIALRRLMLITITQKLFLAIAPVDLDYAQYL